MFVWLKGVTRRAWKFAVTALNVDAPLICEGKYGDIQS